MQNICILVVFTALPLKSTRYLKEFLPVGSILSIETFKDSAKQNGITCAYCNSASFSFKSFISWNILLNIIWSIRCSNLDICLCRTLLQDGSPFSIEIVFKFSKSHCQPYFRGLKIILTSIY